MTGDCPRNSRDGIGKWNCEKFVIKSKRKSVARRTHKERWKTQDWKPSIKRKFTFFAPSSLGAGSLSNKTSERERERMEKFAIKTQNLPKSDKMQREKFKYVWRCSAYRGKLGMQIWLIKMEKFGKVITRDKSLAVQIDNYNCRLDGTLDGDERGALNRKHFVWSAMITILAV